LIAFESLNLKVFTRLTPATDFNVLAVCFQYMLPEQCLDAEGFGEAFFLKYEIDAVFVNCATNEWWQYPDLPDALATVRELAARWKRKVTYGSSMGGYAALRFAASIGASCSVAVGPQYSPLSSAVAGENRYQSLVSRTEFLFEEAFKISPAVTNYIIYDPLFRPDVRHVLRYVAEAPVVPIKIFGAGHTPTIVLQECGLLTECILQLMGDTFSSLQLRKSLRGSRRISHEYWKELILRLLERNDWVNARRIAARAPHFVEHENLIEFIDGLAAGAGALPLPERCAHP
jgi:hypothetical protein